MTEDVRTGNWRLFSPELDDKGVAYARLVQIGSKSATDALAGLADLLQTMDSRQPGGLRLTAAALVLRDLISLGWQTLASGGWLYVRPGPPGLPSKDAARRQLQFGRDDQLSEPSIRKFILTLERPGRGSALRPVTDLIADGRALETDLKVAASLEGAERHQALVRACRPYLQPVSADARDEHTGIRLMDVWRYFRHTWATRYRSSPGRNLFYLIRDGARPFHPVIGITALGNAVMQLGPRDDAIGWTVEGLRRALSDGRVTDAGVLAAFKAPIKEDYLEVFRADLPVPMQLSGSVAGEVLDRLSVIEKQSTDDRAGRLRELDEDDAVTARVHDVQGVDLEKLAKTPLFRAKRARTVRTLLSIYAVLASARSVGELLASETGTRAVNNALRQLKKRFSATSMMEITVCGAVPPYNHLLGGKLACLLMLSPRVRRDYSERYSDAYSIIASQMAGRPVSKPPMLTFLGTSSLYPGRSSQYNRVRLPEGTCEGQESRAEYVELGVSEGYGSPNLSAETESALEALAETERSYRNVNFVFGEGQSPKLRQLREGFAALGLNRSNVLNHGTRRIVYGIDLAENSTRLLLGVDGAPRFRISDTEAAEEQIVDFWRTRWLSNRLRHGPALVAVSASSPLKERVSKLIPERATKVKPDLIKIAQRGGGARWRRSWKRKS